MDVIGKSINYIKLHDLLDRIEVEQTYSTLHAFYNTILKNKREDESMEWNGHVFSEETLEAALKEEDGIVKAISLSEHPSKLWEVTIDFKSGNQFVVRLRNQEQYSQILKYIIQS